MLASFSAWLRRLRGRPAEVPDERALASRQPVAADDWQLVASVGAASMGAMYADLLRQANIPVRMEQWGMGSGGLGGLPVGVRLLVPGALLGAARDVLHVDEAGEGNLHEG